MSRVYLLDCTLRDGGYINNWEFGQKGIINIIGKLEQTGVEMIELGFLKGDDYDINKTLFPDINSVKHVLKNREKNVDFLVMLDMNNPVPLDRIPQNDGMTVDGIRVIFKKDKLVEAYLACEYIKNAGYKVFVNFVNTESYSEKEFIEGIQRFNRLEPNGITIVDTFGMINRRNFRRLVSIADNNMCSNSMLCYHAHNNLQQAYGNAEAFVEMNLARDIVIDACVFGMGRGAGNLNLELFAEYMNENHGKGYRISPMLEIMDEYLSKFYKTCFWGYSLPMYLSARNGCHPNYAMYFAEKNTLPEKAFDELLRGISNPDKLLFDKEKAESYYIKYMSFFIDDSKYMEMISKEIKGEKVLVIAPGKTIKTHKELVDIGMGECSKIISVNFYDELYSPDYVFFGNIRRYNKYATKCKCKVICTSNVLCSEGRDIIINYSSLLGDCNNDVSDNSGLMLLRLLAMAGAEEVMIAGMDGYSENESNDYFASGFEAYPVNRMHSKNDLITRDIRNLRKYMKLTFLTPTQYKI